MHGALSFLTRKTAEGRGRDQKAGCSGGAGVHIQAGRIERAGLEVLPALAREREIEAELRVLNAPWRTAQAFGVEDIIDPRETRPLLCRFIEAAQPALRAALGPKYRAGVRP